MLATTELPFITKTLIPSRRDYFINRKRLVEVLRNQPNVKLSLVCAPAGYGKTTLLSEFASESPTLVCWYTCAPEDRDPKKFIRYNLYSLRSTPANSRRGLLSPVLDAINEDWNTQLGLFVNALYDCSDQEILFIIDDFHLIAGQQELSECISVLIQRSPDNVHFLISSRVWPEISCVPRLRTEHRVNTLDSVDLRFTQEETQQALAKLWSRPVPDEEVQRVFSITEGWPAAVAMTASGFAPSLHKDESTNLSDELLFEYLSKEVFSSLPDSLQSFLLRTSLLSEFTVGFCNRLLERDDARALIEEIKERGLFLEERSGDNTSFAYHALFKEYLEHQFQIDNWTEYLKVNARAGEIYTELEEFEAAISHFLIAREYDRAVDVVKLVAVPYFDQGRWQLLAEWLGQFPAHMIEQDPRLLLLKGQVLQRLGDQTGALEVLDRVITISDNLDSLVLGTALVAKCPAYRRLGHFDLALDSANHGIEILTANQCENEHIAQGWRQIALCHAMQGKNESAEALLHKALGMTSMEQTSLWASIASDLGVVYMELGQLDEAARYFEQAKACRIKMGADSLLAETQTNQGLAYYHLGEFDLALDECSESLAIARRAGYPRIEATALMNQGLCQQALHSTEESIESASRALDLSRQLLDQRLIAESTKVLGNGYRMLGETSKAETLLRQAILEAEDSSQLYIASSYRLALGKVYCQIGEHDQASFHFRAALDYFIGQRNLRRTAEARMYESAIQYRTGRLSEALQTLSQVATDLDQLGYDGFLLADSADVLDVLRFAVAKRVGGGAFERMLDKVMRKSAYEYPVPFPKSSAARPGQFPTVHVTALGNPRVFLDQHEVTSAEWKGKKSKELLFFLLCKQRNVTGDEILDSLWRYSSAGVSTDILKTNIYRLRSALFHDCIMISEHGYTVNPDVDWDFDVSKFLGNLQLAEDKFDDITVNKSLVSQAVKLYQGPFLRGYYSEWCEDFRANLEAKYNTAVVTLASHRMSRDDYPGAIKLLEDLVSADPYNDDAQYMLIRAYIGNGNHLGGLNRLRRYAKLCLEELGIDLGQRFLECHQEMLERLPISG